MYINTQTNQYPVSETDIKAAFPNVSFASPFTAPSEYAVVFPAPQPTYNVITETVKETAPELTSKGTWEQRWEVVTLPDDVIAANQTQAAAKLQENIVDATQKRLDTFAKTKNYDGILSLCTYATDLNPKFQAEGQYGVQARSATWSKLYEILAEVQAGTRPVPTGFSDVESELPSLNWPE